MESVAEWTISQENALAEVIGWTPICSDWPGSAEIPKMLQRANMHPGSQQALPWESGIAPELPGSATVESISSPFGGEPLDARDFWLSVNAELIVYGATDPSTQLTLGGQPIRLRSDGTFSCRLALPDGHHELAIVAESPQGEVRRVRLEFQRATACQGEVGVQPPDPNSKGP
jgi:hypothetical protein